MLYTYEKEKKESKPLEKVQLKHLIIPFLILGIVCFLALFVFLCELKGKKAMLKSQQANNGENKNMESFSSD